MDENLAGKASTRSSDLPLGDDAVSARLSGLVPERDPQVTVLLITLTRLARRNDAALARLAAGHGLLPSETSVLAALWWAGPPHRLRPTTLAEALLQTSGGMTATLRRLESAGFVERVADPADRRVLLAALTPDGADAARAALDDQVAHWEQALAGWTPARRRRAATSVRALLDALEAEDRRGRTRN